MFVFTVKNSKILFLKQEWLKPDEFESVMGVSRDKFFGLAPWQQAQKKKKAGL